MEQNVAVTGWEEAEVLVRLPTGAAEDLSVEQTEDGPAVSAREDCEVYVPTGLPVSVVEVKGNLAAKEMGTLQVEKARANLQVKAVEGAALVEVYGNLDAKEVASLQVKEAVYGNATVGELEAVDLKQVRGSLSAKEVGQLQVERVSGNLYAKEIRGPLTVDRVGGNALLKEVGGAVSLEKVGGNFTAKGLAAGAKVAKIGGNLALNGEIGAGCTYHFKAGGNGLLRLGEEASVHLTLNAGGGIQVAANLTDVERSRNSLRGTLGEGGAEVVLEAGGNILVGGKGPLVSVEVREEVSRQLEESLRLMEDSLRAIDFEAIGQQVSAEMDRAMAKLQVKLGEVDWENLGRRTQRSIERAMEHMQRDIDRAVERVARRQEKLERVAERAAYHRDFAHRGMGEPRAAQPAPDLDAERLEILKMLEEGKISAAEAETLLAALD
jgi:ribosome-associated translation inhibitor RaiA